MAADTPRLGSEILSMSQDLRPAREPARTTTANKQFNCARILPPPPTLCPLLRFVSRQSPFCPFCPLHFPLLEIVRLLLHLPMTILHMKSNKIWLYRELFREETISTNAVFYRRNMSGKVHKLIILRHGESQWNHENKFCGWIDIPLSEKGKLEAANAGKLIKQFGLDPDIIYTSKLTRLIESGLIILQYLNKLWINHIKTWRLNERHYGQYQGRDKHEVFKSLNSDKEQFQYIRRNYHGLPPLIEGKDPSIDERYLDIVNKDILPRGESLELVMKRLIPYFVLEIVHHQLIQLDKTVLIVTHGLIVRSLIKYLSNVSDDDISNINVPTGVPLVFEIDDNAELVRDYYYLDPELAQRGMEKVKNEGLKKEPHVNL